MFQEYLARWTLTPDGLPFSTPSSHLLPVRHHGEPAMLKIANEPEEQFGGLLMVWWKGEGAARVLDYHENAWLLERAVGHGSLIEMSRNGQDAEATEILCASIARLHAHRDAPPELVPLRTWFRDLAPAAEQFGGILRESAGIATELLTSPHEPVVLHGDVHHGNILDFGPRGWLAIDPKGLYGDRAFDYANLFCNFDPRIATSPPIFARRLAIACQAANLERDYLLRWLLAWAGLSAAWMLLEIKTPPPHWR